MPPHTRSVSANPLGDVPIFATLTDDMQAQLADQATTVQLKAGDWLFEVGDPGDSLYVVLSGRLEVVMEDPEPTVIRVLGRGDAFGELALLTGSPRSASVRARRDTELLMLVRDDFVRLLDHEPGFTRALTTWLGHQLRQSRGLGIETPPVPATIALVPLQLGLPARKLADHLVRELGRWRTVAWLERPGVDNGDEQESSDAARLDRAERSSGQVVLLADEPDAPGQWTEFCLRQADRVVALVGSEGIPPRSELPALLGGDVVYCGGSRRNIDTAAWHDAIGPRATHLLPSGSGFPLQLVADPNPCPPQVSCGHPRIPVSAPSNPLRFAGFWNCRNARTDIVFDYTIYLVDARGVRTQAVDAVVTCRMR